MGDEIPERQFICDRMAGSLCRYLRLMGYDTLDANDLPMGNRREDTLLLKTAEEENRIVLTRDAELARRDRRLTLYLAGEKLEDQIRQLTKARLITPLLRLTRCSVCNNLLIPLSDETLSRHKDEITDIIPDLSPEEGEILWCQKCRKAYWEGSHTRSMKRRIDLLTRGQETES